MSERARMPFKFDAWHTKKKVWFTAEEMARDQLTLMPDGSGFINVHSADGRLSQLMDHLIPVPYTGLHDVDGNEARENDLVRYLFKSDAPDEVWGTGVICWHRIGWFVKPDDSANTRLDPDVCIFHITGSAYEMEDEDG